MLGFVVGDLLNDIVFKRLKNKDNDKKFSKRAILSSFVGEITDSLIFIPIAFYGTMPISSMFIMLVTQVVLKVMYEIIILPLTNLVVKTLKRNVNISDMASLFTLPESRISEG